MDRMNDVIVSGLKDVAIGAVGVEPTTSRL